MVCLSKMEKTKFLKKQFYKRHELEGDLLEMVISRTGRGGNSTDGQELHNFLEDMK